MRSASLGDPFANNRASNAEDRSWWTIINSPSSELQLVLAMSLADVLCLVLQMFPNVKRFRFVSTAGIKSVRYRTG